MIFDTFSIEKRIEERARNEVEIVSAVRRHLEDKISEFDDADVELNHKRKLKALELLEKRKSGASERELRRMADAIIRIDKQISLNNTKTDDFYNIFDIVFDLEIYVEALIDFGWYRYVVKAIPEKKLPAMVNNENELIKVAGLVETIIGKIQAKMLRSFKTRAEYEAAIQKIEARSKLLKSNYIGNAKARDLDDIALELEKEYGLADTEYTKPVSAPAAAQANNKNGVNA